jgi:DNA-binding Lrp family transcriptional regulator
MDETDRRILMAVQDGLPLVKDPFGAVGAALDLDRDQVICRLQGLIRNGVVRRFGARVNHRRLGIVVNAMVGWNVPDDLVERIGMQMARSSAVTHCYEREVRRGDWNYNLFTVHHGYTREEVEDQIASLARETGIDEHIVLYSVEECKRSTAGRLYPTGERRP